MKQKMATLHGRFNPSGVCSKKGNGMSIGLSNDSPKQAPKVKTILRPMNKRNVKVEK